MILPAIEPANERARILLEERSLAIYRRTDRMFAWLMLFQWWAGLAIAIWISPWSWEGKIQFVHPHIWAALILGGLICSLPVMMAWLFPGKAVTRQTIAIGQALASALLIHLMGGRIEAHFHIFGSLAFLAFYRDWKVLVTASLVIAIDHLARGVLWPESIYGVTVQTWERSLEHIVWVIFEDGFLIYSTIVSRNEMTAMANRRAEQEEVNVRIEQEVRDRTRELELQRLVLEQSHQQLQEQADALREAKLAAEGASRAKSAFLANMSHEIRTPLTAILGYADVLLENGDIQRAPAARVEAIDAVRRNGRHLVTLINDLLDLSKIEAGKFQMEQLSCSPFELWDEIHQMMQVRATEKKLELALRVDGLAPATITTDPMRLRQILTNLVGNAIKFTEQGRIEGVMRLIEENGKPQLQIDVRDTGIGISDDVRDKLFQPFTQADGSMSRRFGGTGLGLTISKRFAELLGGDLTILETSPQGSTFRLTIDPGPLEGVALRGEGQKPPASLANPRPLADWKNALEGMKLLLVEDGVDNQRLISFLLKKSGGTVHLAENGQIGYDLAMAAAAEGMPFDVILMDMQMPIMDGYTATRTLRENGYEGPIVALTAHAMADDRRRCLDAGCTDFATKPIDRDKLIAQIARYAPTSVPASSPSPGEPV